MKRQPGGLGGIRDRESTDSRPSKFFFLLTLLIAACRTLEPPPLPAPQESEPAVVIPSAPLPKPEIEEKPAPQRLILVGAGDNLFHDTVITSSLENGGYNFSPIYQEIRPLIEKADLAFINQETVLGGEALGYSGYPRFNTPQILAEVLAETGFDIVNHATNHAMDMGEAGLTAAMDAWDAVNGVIYLGIHRQEKKSPVLITRNGITFGFLSYTYGTNGLPLPKSKPWLVSLINREAMAAEIDALRPLCDVLIVSMHWGEEYTPDPVKTQTDLAAFLAEHQADVIIGHHPHVLQRFEVLPRPGGKETLCFYSLGNFVSNQRPKETLLGALMYLEIRKDGDAVLFDAAGLIPVITHYEQGFTKTRVYPLYAYGAELLEKHFLYSQDKNFRPAFFDALLQRLNSPLIMEDPYAPERGF